MILYAFLLSLSCHTVWLDFVHITISALLYFALVPFYTCFFRTFGCICYGWLQCTNQLAVRPAHISMPAARIGLAGKACLGCCKGYGANSVEAARTGEVHASCVLRAALSRQPPIRMRCSILLLLREEWSLKAASRHIGSRSSSSRLHWLRMATRSVTPVPIQYSRSRGHPHQRSTRVNSSLSGQVA